MPNFISRRKKKECRVKITGYCAKRLEDFRHERGLQSNELERIVGLIPSRVSEVRAGILSEPSLLKMLEGGILTVGEILEGVDGLDEADREYLRSFALLESNLNFARLTSILEEKGLKKDAEKFLEKLVSGDKEAIKIIKS